MKKFEGFPREIIALRVSREIEDNSYVNLGIGIPTLVSNWLEGRDVILQSEIGMLKTGSLAEGDAVDIVGPICETGDFLAKDRRLPPLEPGDLLALMSAGAYGFTMSSNYNSRLRVPEVLVKGDRYQVVRSRETYEDLVRGETIPDWS